ncbi:hypothetical protein GCM10027341_48770 [Spirosoma knui]
MSYDEITTLVKDIDNLVCAEGVTLFMWYLNEKDDFDHMIYEAHIIDNGLRSIWDYEDSLLAMMQDQNYGQRKKNLAKHKELWLTLITKSELSLRYFTPNDVDMFRRLSRFGRMEVVIDLNPYNFISQELLQEYKKNGMIEIGGHKILSYVISWKKELLRRYYLINELEAANKLESNNFKGVLYGTRDILSWNISYKQVIDA